MRGNSAGRHHFGFAKVALCAWEDRNHWQKLQFNLGSAGRLTILPVPCESSNLKVVNKRTPIYLSSSFIPLAFYWPFRGRARDRVGIVLCFYSPRWRFVSQTEISGKYNSPFYFCFLSLFFLSLFLPQGSVYCSNINILFWTALWDCVEDEFLPSVLCNFV